MKQRHRIFIAINVTPDVKKELAGYEQRWPDLPAKWTESENLHITLAFIGYVTDTELGEICLAVKEVAEQHGSFNISLSKVMYGPPGKFRMIWARGEKSKELSQLKRDLENALLEKINFKEEQRTFAPHITLARIKEWEFRQINLDERPEVNESIDIPISVESIDVMESVLKKSGPEYQIIESYSLQ